MRLYPPVPQHLRHLRQGVRIFDVRRPDDAAVFQRWVNRPTTLLAVVKYPGEKHCCLLAAENMVTAASRARKFSHSRNTQKLWDERYGLRVASIARKTGVSPSHVKAVLQAAGVAI